MKQSRGLFDLSYRLGDYLLMVIRLHFLWFFFVLRWGIIFGFFPATATVIRYFFELFAKKPLPAELYSWFKQQTAKNFWRSNQLGLLQMAILLLLWIELRISSTFLQNAFLHFGLTVLFISGLLISFYLLPVFVRYHLPFWVYFRNAFLLMIVSVPQTIAMILGVFLVTFAATFLPILLFIAFIPLFLWPISWFAYQAIQKTELLTNEH
ncbi:YesL family protein [Enterococcus gallinarum]|uniref:YesL family protein n=1 Tax=Enterococcus gallinarum TaxID=1353 RepID=UPI0027E1F200|nr:DUF624 domain-containing protein [Enterococcus gallinarum]MDQ6110667.1 DUF624 domain-containing protein [Enterococcus gallinarum]